MFLKIKKISFRLIISIFTLGLSTLCLPSEPAIDVKDFLGFIATMTAGKIAIVTAHELGHALTAKAFVGGNPIDIELFKTDNSKPLFQVGGIKLCSLNFEKTSYCHYRYRPSSKINLGAVSLAGPIAGFITAMSIGASTNSRYVKLGANFNAALELNNLIPEKNDGVRNDGYVFASRALGIPEEKLDAYQKHFEIIRMGYWMAAGCIILNSFTSEK